VPAPLSYQRERRPAQCGLIGEVDAPPTSRPGTAPPQRSPEPCQRLDNDQGKDCDIRWPHIGSVADGDEPETVVPELLLGSRMAVASRSFSSPLQTDRGERVDGSDGIETAEAARRVARNQALFRSVNERIESSNERFGVTLERAEFLCECADQHCMERVTLTLGRYEEVRRVPTHFIVIPSHVYREFERVVEQVDAYVVVETFGEAGKESLKLDERHTPTYVHL
jgi:hypothetical protein